MTGTPRFVFHVMDDSDGGRRSTPVLWRLIAGNGRELARAAYASDGFHSSREAVVSMQSSIRRGHMSAACNLGLDGQWFWRVDVSGTAASGPTLRRESECRAALERFLALAPEAALARGCTSRRVGPRARLLRDRSVMSLSLVGPVRRAS